MVIKSKMDYPSTAPQLRFLEAKEKDTKRRLDWRCLL